MANVAFIGLGVMGYPMAGHLAKRGGHRVTVYNRNAAKAARWVVRKSRQDSTDAERSGDGRRLRLHLCRQ